MNELHAILEAFEQSQYNAEPAYLATVVNVKGSTYRQPGARMLMTEASRMVGTISGGCLEKDVFEHTRFSMPDGQPIVVTYDTTADEDIVWGFGLGCNGVVQVLIERLDDHLLNPIAFIKQCFCNQQQGIIATVFDVKGQVNIKVGARLMLNPDSSVTTDIEEPCLTVFLAKDAQIALQAQHSSVNKYQLMSGSVDVFIEVIQPPTRLIIFGAGHDAVPTTQFAKAMGWHVTIVDCRASEVTRERFSMADEVILTRREILHKQISLDEHTIAVVMTHNYLDDLQILKMLMPSPARYLGFLGSKHRTEKLLLDLRAEGVDYTSEQLQRLHGPVGIDIGANTPEAIALSIISEIQAVQTNRCGGFLKERSLPIHQRHETKETQLVMTLDSEALAT